MTIEEALSITDEMKPNMMRRNLKLKYLTEIEQLIWHEIICKHYSNDYTPPAPYNPETDPLNVGWGQLPIQTPEPDEAPEYDEESDQGTELLIPDPYSMVYVYWLMSKVDIQNQEDARYNIDRAHFETAYKTMSDWYTRKHMPVQRTREIRI